VSAKYFETKRCPLRCSAGARVEHLPVVGVDLGQQHGGWRARVDADDPPEPGDLELVVSGSRPQSPKRASRCAT
jgi:hypothetical protein